MLTVSVADVVGVAVGIAIGFLDFGERTFGGLFLDDFGLTVWLTDALRLENGAGCVEGFRSSYFCGNTSEGAKPSEEVDRGNTDFKPMAERKTH